MVLLETNPAISEVSAINVGHTSFFRAFAEHIGGTTLVASGRDTVQFFDYSNISTYAVVDSITNLASLAYGYCAMPTETFYFLGTNDIEKRNRSDNLILETLALPFTEPYVVFNIPQSTYIIVLYGTSTSGGLYNYSLGLTLEETITKNEQAHFIIHIPSTLYYSYPKHPKICKHR